MLCPRIGITAQYYKKKLNKYLVRCTYLVYCLVRAKRYPSPQQQNCQCELNETFSVH